MPRLNKFESLMILGILIVDILCVYFIWLEIQVIEDKNSRSHN